MKRNERGITLIALIITVIVLLILAGTVITIAISGGNIFSKAEDAVSQYNEKVKEEELATGQINVLLMGKDKVFWGLYEYSPTEYHLVYNTTGNIAQGYTEEQLVERSEDISNGCGSIQVSEDVYKSDQKWEPYANLITKVIIEEEIYPKSTLLYFYKLINLKEIENLHNISPIFLKSTKYMFAFCSSLTSLDLRGFNTQNVESMAHMFTNCTGLTNINLQGFNTQNATDISYMFYNCSGLTNIDVSSFNTSKVENIRDLFAGCSSLTSIDLSNFDTKNVKNMIALFYYCSSLKRIDLSKFDTRNVEEIVSAFWGCSSLESINLSSFNTLKIKRLNHMFRECSALKELDLSSFNTFGVTQMTHVFRDCTNLEKVYVSDGWSTDNVTTSNSIFSNCGSIKGGAGTTFMGTNILYAQVDGGQDDPGYFTYKANPAATAVTQ